MTQLKRWSSQKWSKKVIALYGAGCDVSEIARELGMSAGLVRRYLQLAGLDAPEKLKKGAR